MDDVGAPVKRLKSDAHQKTAFLFQILLAPELLQGACDLVDYTTEISKKRASKRVEQESTSFGLLLELPVPQST